MCLPVLDSDLSLAIQSGCRVYQFCYIVDGVAFSGVKHARSGDVIRLCCRTFLPVGTVCKSEPNGANDVAVCLGTLSAVLLYSRTLCYCILDLTIRTTQQDSKRSSERNSLCDILQRARTGFTCAIDCIRCAWYRVCQHYFLTASLGSPLSPPLYSCCTWRFFFAVGSWIFEFNCRQKTHMCPRTQLKIHDSVLIVMHFALSMGMVQNCLAAATCNELPSHRKSASK